MGMEESYFVDTCQIMSATRDRFGESETITLTRISCYIQWKTRKVKDINGNDAIAAATVICSDQDISYDDKIIISSKEYSIIQINQKMALNLQHMEVLIQ